MNDFKKYRPSTLNECVDSKTAKEVIKKCLSTKNIKGVL